PNPCHFPTRGRDRASTAAPYDIETVFFQRVDWAIGQALSRKFGRRHQRASLRRDEPRSSPKSPTPGGTLETDRAALSESAEEPDVRAAERAARPARR